MWLPKVNCIICWMALTLFVSASEASGGQNTSAGQKLLKNTQEAQSSESHSTDSNNNNNYQQYPMDRRRGRGSSNGIHELQATSLATDSPARIRGIPSNKRKRRRRPVLSAVEYIHDSAAESEVSSAARARERSDTSRQRRSRKGSSRRRYKGRHRQDLALWIDHQQVQQLSGYPMEIYVIREGRVLPYVLDPHFDTRLPIIPPEVSSFNFTWQGGRRKRYRYQMDNLVSEDRSVMADPTVSIPTKGRMPKKPKGFQIELPCTWNASGVAWFSVRLKLKTRTNKRVHGTPLNVRLRKRCHPIEPQASGSVCPAGYLGPNCSEALCYPHCMHGGVCSAPGRCSCPHGYHGRYCQGGICSEKCLNGGKCIQKDKCSCTRGFYGDTCQYSKCVVPCVNGGVCRGANKCRCPSGFGGQHCEVSRHRGVASPSRCLQRCRLGTCDADGRCRCQDGYTGRWCRRRSRNDQKRVWL